MGVRTPYKIHVGVFDTPKVLVYVSSFLLTELSICGTVCYNGVVHAESTNMFKIRLDKFWMNQEIIYDYRAEIQGTGSRSEIY